MKKNQKKSIYSIVKKVIVKFINLILNIFNFRVVGVGTGKVRFEKNMFFNTIEVLESLFFPKDCLTVFDVGAFEGQFSKAISKKFKKGRYILFEPNQTMVNYMNEKYKCYNWQIHSIAISDRVEKSILYKFSETGSGNSLVKPKENYESSETVETSTIDTFCESNNIQMIDILKLDIQGNEDKCLKGAEKMISKNFIKVIIVEIMLHETYTSTGSFAKIENILGPYNYKLWDLSFIKKSYSSKRTLMVDAIYINPEKYRECLEKAH